MRRLLTIVVGLLMMGMTHAGAQDFESATEAVRNMGVGWNLGNTLDAHNGQAVSDIVRSETMWGQPVTQGDLMQMMKEAGFGTIRIPVTWYPHMDAAGKVDEAWMKRVHEVVDYVVSQGLYCLLNVHHDTGADGDDHVSWLKADMDVYNQVKAKYEYLWRQIATEFRDYDEHLLFESYNEMLDSYSSWCFASFASPERYNATKAASAYDAINHYAQSFVDAVRSTGGNNAQRNLVVNTYGACNGVGTWNSHLLDPLKEMRLPKDQTEGHLMFQVHTYPDISNMANAKKEVTQMIADLKTYLVSQGAPVIIGEWGTHELSTDYLNKRADVLAFARFMIETTKTNGMGTFEWMGLSDGIYRSLPAFNQPDLAETIVKAYHGDGFQGLYPTIDDFEMVFTINYTDSWQEMNLYDGSLTVSDYKGILLELKETPPTGTLSAKFYGPEKSGTTPITAARTLITFPTAYGTTLRRVTLQYNKSGNYSNTIDRIALVKKDGTEIEVTPTVFWGCVLTVETHRKTTGIAQTAIKAPSGDARIYTLMGRQLTTAPTQGLYIRNGRKILNNNR